jgi:hypothetical protein
MVRFSVLISDISENQEMVDRVGFTFKRGDVADLERMLRLLLDDSAVRSAAGRSAQHRVRDGYLWPRIARQVEQVYLEAMGWKGFQSDPDELPSMVPEWFRNGSGTRERRVKHLNPGEQAE